jgi:hypothetical protein
MGFLVRPGGFSGSLILGRPVREPEVDEPLAVADSADFALETVA